MLKSAMRMLKKSNPHSALAGTPAAGTLSPGVINYFFTRTSANFSQYASQHISLVTPGIPPYIFIF
ncbi:hypothetical protein GCM10027361_17200 [Erwinia aphidicola]|jgi:hypothetical protein